MALGPRRLHSVDDPFRAIYAQKNFPMGTPPKPPKHLRSLPKIPPNPPKTSTLRRCAAPNPKTFLRLRRIGGKFLQRRWKIRALRDKRMRLAAATSKDKYAEARQHACVTHPNTGSNAHSRPYSGAPGRSRQKQRQRVTCQAHARGKESQSLLFAPFYQSVRSSLAASTLHPGPCTPRLWLSANTGERRAVTYTPYTPSTRLKQLTLPV